MAEAARWFKYLGEKYPDKPIIENQPDSLPKNLTLDEYVVAVVNIDIGETSQERVTSAVQGFLTHAYLDLAIGQDDRAAGFQVARRRMFMTNTRQENARSASRLAAADERHQEQRAEPDCSTPNKGCRSPRAPCCAPSLECRRKPMRRPKRFRPTPSLPRFCRRQPIRPRPIPPADNFRPRPPFRIA